MRGNICVGNNGAGIALVGDLDSRGTKWKAFHWIIEGNRLQENRWGIFAQYADWIKISCNHFVENRERDILTLEGVSRMDITLDSPNETAVRPAAVKLIGPQIARVQDVMKFTCELETESTDFTYFWDLGDGTTATSAEVEHSYRQPGFYRLGVNVTGPSGTELAYRDLYVAANQPELAADASLWDFEAVDTLRCTFSRDKKHYVAGEDAVRVVLDPYHGFSARMLYPKTRNGGWPLASKTHFAFWFKAINPNLPGWQSNNPELTLYQTDQRKLRLTPKRDLFTDAKYSEARDGWRYFEIPLSPHPDWDREGEDLSTINFFTIGIDSWDSQPLQVWIDGLVLF